MTFLLACGKVTILIRIIFRILSAGLQKEQVHSSQLVCQKLLPVRRKFKPSGLGFHQLDPFAGAKVEQKQSGQIGLN